MSRPVSLSLSAALLGACSLLGGYPDPVAEAGTLCMNLHDDNLDGLRDCADPSCDGSAPCPESSLALCADGRDNDRDGRRDQEDMSCWPFSRFEVRRCESVEGSRWRGSFRAGTGGWETIEGGTVSLDPVDPALDEARVETGGLLLGPTLTGGLEPATLRVRLAVPSTAVVEVGLMIGGSDLRGVTPPGLFLRFEHGDLAVAGSNETLVPAVGTAPETFVDVEIEITQVGDAVPRYEMRVGGVPLVAPAIAFTGRGPLEVPSEVVAGRTFVPVVRVVAGSARIAAASAELSGIDPCDYAVPQVGATLRALAHGSDGWCAVSEGEVARGGRAHVWASPDLVRFTDVAEIDGPGIATGELRAAGSTLLWDGDGYEGLVAITDTSPTRALTRTVIRLRGLRCDALATEDLFATRILPLSNGNGISPGLAVDPTASPHYRMTLSQIVAGIDVSLTLGHLFSEDGSAYGDLELEPIPNRFYGDTFGGVQFLDLGADRALLIATDRGIEVVLERDGGRFETLLDAIVPPSGRPGTFDELLVSSPVLALDPPVPPPAMPRQTGHIAVTGEVVCRDPDDDGSCTLSSGVLELEIVPRTDLAP